MERLTNEQKEQMIKEFESRQAKILRTGKVIVIVIILLVGTAYSIISSVLLFTSKCVSEYMYAVKH